MFGETQIKQLQKFHNGCDRIIMNMSDVVDHKIKLSALGWEPLIAYREKVKAKLMFKALN